MFLVCHDSSENLGNSSSFFKGNFYLYKLEITLDFFLRNSFVHLQKKHTTFLCITIPPQNFRFKKIYKIHFIFIYSGCEAKVITLLGKNCYSPWWQSPYFATSLFMVSYNRYTAVSPGITIKFTIQPCNRQGGGGLPGRIFLFQLSSN